MTTYTAQDLLDDCDNKDLLTEWEKTQIKQLEAEHNLSKCTRAQNTRKWKKR